MREEVLLLMLYLNQQGKINLHESELCPLVKISALDAEKLTIQTIKMNYWWMKHDIEKWY